MDASDDAMKRRSDELRDAIAEWLETHRPAPGERDAAATADMGALMFFAALAALGLRTSEDEFAQFARDAYRAGLEELNAAQA